MRAGLKALEKTMREFESRQHWSSLKEMKEEVIEKDCESCKHLRVDSDKYPCNKCDYNDMICNKWEANNV